MDGADGQVPDAGVFSATPAGDVSGALDEVEARVQGVKNRVVPVTSSLPLPSTVITGRAPWRRA